MFASGIAIQFRTVPGTIGNLGEVLWAVRIYLRHRPLKAMAYQLDLAVCPGTGLDCLVWWFTHFLSPYTVPQQDYRQGESHY